VRASTGTSKGNDAEWQVTRFAAPRDVTIRERLEPPRIDGDLGDWSADEALVVDRQFLGRAAPEASDISVRAAFAFDPQSLYVAVWATDNELQFPERAWRYGDGILITFGDSAGPTTNRFSTFGFARRTKTNGEAVTVLVNRDGQYFQYGVEEIKSAVVADPVKHTVTYEISIPLEYVRACRPYASADCGINLTYIDGDGTDRKSLQLVADMDADSKDTAFRRVRPARFVPSPKGPQRCVATALQRQVIAGESVEARIDCISSGGVNAPSELRSTLLAGPSTIAEVVKQFATLPDGLVSSRVRLDVPAEASGRHTLASMITVGGRKVLDASSDVFVLGREVFALMDLKPEPAAARSPLLPALEIRQEWIARFLRDAPATADPAPLEKQVADVQRLLGILSGPNATWSERDAVFRFAHRSAFDGSLQPYSVYVPRNYDPTKPPPLLVTLHGSGVNEIDTMKGAVRSYADAGWLILAPLARGVSDWYLGPAGDDVLESMKHLATVLPYDSRRVMLEGFSMGGYGAWRLALLHPGKFTAVAIMSGGTEPPTRFASDESVPSLLERSPKSNPAFLIVHGGRDQAIPIAPVKAVVQKLRRRKVKHDFVELPDAGHGDYDETARVRDWFRSQLH